MLPSKPERVSKLQWSPAPQLRRRLVCVDLVVVVVRRLLLAFPQSLLQKVATLEESQEVLLSELSTANSDLAIATSQMSTHRKDVEKVSGKLEVDPLSNY